MCQAVFAKAELFFITIAIYRVLLKQTVCIGCNFSYFQAYLKSLIKLF